MKRLLALLLTLLMAFSCLPLPFATAQTSEFSTQIEPQVNPLYEDTLDAADLVFPDAPVPPAASSDYVTEDEAALHVREYLKARTTEFTVYVKSQSTDTNALFKNLLNLAMAHTGNPTEGDYLRFQYGGARGSMSRSFDGTWYCYRITYEVSYYVTAEQEAEMDLAVDALLTQLALDDLSDYEKVRGVYDYMCANITYDYTNLNDASYMLKYSAYAALVNKTAVCQGYAVLLYRLLLELGVDTRVVTGIGNGGGHAWNIVKLGNLYYNADATWDSSWHQAGLDYNYFLRNEYNFTEGGTDHIRNEEYDTAEFHQAYPMSETDYDPTATPPQDEPIPYGDLDGNGDVDAADLTLLARHVAKIDPLTGQALINADVDRDGDVDSNDLTIHARYVAKIITSWDEALQP